MTSPGADALLQVSSGNFRALRQVYEEHASAAWGLALVVTRSRRRAAGVLQALFDEISRSPERFADGRDLRVTVLAAALRLASQEERRKRRRWWRPVRRSRALAAPVDAALAQRLAGADENEAIRISLEAAEGLFPEQLAATGPMSRGATPCVASWRRPPSSLRSPILMRATEAARPERKYVRWFLLWLAPLAGLVLARLSERTAPRLPVEKYSPPAVRAVGDEASPVEKAKLPAFLREEERR